MNALGVELLWLALQISVLCALATAVHLVARRGSPSSGATASLTGLVLVAALSLAAASPWPRWEIGEATPANNDASFAGISRASAGNGSGNASVSEASPGIRKGDASGLFSGDFVEAFLSEFQEQLQQPASQPVAQGLSWSGWLAIVFLTGVGIGSVRLILGLLSVRKLKMSSRFISDPTMEGILDELCAEFECTAPVRLVETGEVVSAATIGWRKPLILLPLDWSTWTDQERRSVLAHEIAHIRHNDFFCWLCAQAGLLLHFYHPLVHWLANRLRLEQELAADALAARHSGGAQPYLTTLAELALRQPERPVAWPARTFLPTRGTLLKRIEMLRDNSTRRFVPSRWRRGAVIFTMLVAGLFLSGIRQPAGTEAVAQDTVRDAKRKAAAQQQKARAQAQVAQARADVAAQVEAARPFDLKLVPPTTSLMVAVRPGSIVQDRNLKPMLPLIGQLTAQVGLDLANIEQFLMVGFPYEGARMPMGDDPLMMITLKKDGDFSKLISRAGRKTVENEYHGMKYRRSAGSSGLNAFYQPNARTLIFGREPMVRYVMDYASAGGGLPLWNRKFASVATDQMAFLADLNVLRASIRKELNGPAAEGLPAVFSPLWERTELVVAGSSIGDKTHLNVTAFCDSEEGAKRVQNTAQSLIPLARNGLDSFKKNLADLPPQAVGPSTMLLQFAENTLVQAEFKQDGRQVNLSIQTESGSVPILVGLLLPAVQSAREAARRTQSANNLKQIMIGLHNYHDVHRKFPPPVLTGPDGETKYSWRVEILPYLEQKELYDEYNRDEPWNSPGNLKVMQKMPPVYLSPGDDRDSVNTSYFALVGESTGFGKADGEGNQIATFTDGTSNTAMVVEARREIEWTRPMDIDIDFEKKLPKFGGLHPHGYNLALADGSVHFIMKALDEAVLKAVLTRNGGEDAPNLH